MREAGERKWERVVEGEDGGCRMWSGEGEVKG